MNSDLQVWRFDDGVVRSHVIAGTGDEATEIFDRVMGREYRDGCDDMSVEIYPVPGNVELPIAFDGGNDFVAKTADEWIEYHGEPCFL